jgi:hypothetical protein
MQKLSNRDDPLVYLTDLALYGDQSIIQHIIFKQGIEKDLNHALMALSTPR